MPSQLLELYQSRFGAAKHQGNGWNGPCPLCGGEPGKSDRFVVWPDRAENLGECCTRNNLSGIWSCRQCGASGDTIAYLMKIDGLDFRQSCAELGIEGARPAHRQRRAPTEPRPQSRVWTPKICPAPTAIWSDYATKLVSEAAPRLQTEASALHWLAGRGLDAEAVRTNRGKPDAATHALLQESVRICIALDYDSPGAEGVDFWEAHYPQARRWPTPEGKDPGDAFRLGVNIPDWIQAALPASFPQICGKVDNCRWSVACGGRGRAPRSACSGKEGTRIPSDAYQRKRSHAAAPLAASRQTPR